MDKDLVYFAGLFDGEGSIYINKQKGKHVARTGYNYALRVCLRMTNEQIVKDFATYFSLKAKPIPNSKVEWKPLWRAETTSNKALFILKKLKPYLRIKKAQTVLAIHFQENRPKGNRFHGRTNPELLRLERCYQQMKELNKRGK